MSCACVTRAGNAPGAPGRGEPHVFRAHAKDQRIAPGERCVGRHDALPRNVDTRAVRARRQKVHARRADEVAHERVSRTLEQIGCAADLHRPAASHDHDLVGEREGLHLVMRDVDQRELELVVDLLQLAPQLPLEMRIDHGQRLVEQHCRHVFAHQAAAERDLLLGVGCQAGGTMGELAAQFQHLRNLADTLLDRFGRHAAIAQREGKVLGHSHRVVDDRKLENLSNVALPRRASGNSGAVELHAALRRSSRGPRRC